MIGESLSGMAGFGLTRRGKVTEAVGVNTAFNYFRRQGNTWQFTRLPITVAQESLLPAYADPAGTIAVLGLRRAVPVVAALGRGADPALPASWAVKPEGDSTAWSALYPAAATDLQVVLDWPHQLIFAAWKARQQAHVAWAPVGATTAAAWREAVVPLPEGTGTVNFRLRSNGHGGVGLLVHHITGGEPGLRFHWLSASGLGAEIPILRPGTETEASVYSNIDSEGFDFAIDDRGTAHLAIVGAKRGEVPANAKRVYYATVTGGGTSTTGPEVAGGGTTEMEREGPAPDFVVTLVEPAANEELHFGTGSSLLSQPLAPRVEITNQGAQYFGDLVLGANVDGAVVRLRIPDESNHREALFLRGQKRTYFLPQFVYHYKYEADKPAPSATLDYSSRLPRLALYTGLGRKNLTITVDPDNAIPEVDEQNNVVRSDYLVRDGYPQSDRERDANSRYVYGLNDLSIMPPRLRSKTRLLKAGYVQRPTQLDVVVCNARLAGFFLGAEVVVTLDGQELSRQTVPVLDRTPSLRSAYLGQTIIYENPRRSRTFPALFSRCRLILLRWPRVTTSCASSWTRRTSSLTASVRTTPPS